MKTKAQLKTKMVPVKMTTAEYRAIKKLAKIHAGGNVSRWIRTSALQDRAV